MKHNEQTEKREAIAAFVAGTLEALEAAAAEKQQRDALEAAEAREALARKNAQRAAAQTEEEKQQRREAATLAALEAFQRSAEAMEAVKREAAKLEALDALEAAAFAAGIAIRGAYRLGGSPKAESPLRSLYRGGCGMLAAQARYDAARREAGAAECAYIRSQRAKASAAKLREWREAWTEAEAEKAAAAAAIYEAAERDTNGAALEAFGAALEALAAARPAWIASGEAIGAAAYFPEAPKAAESEEEAAQRKARAPFIIALRAASAAIGRAKRFHARSAARVEVLAMNEASGEAAYIPAALDVYTLEAYDAFRAALRVVEAEAGSVAARLVSYRLEAGAACTWTEAAKRLHISERTAQRAAAKLREEKAAAAIMRAITDGAESVREAEAQREAARLARLEAQREARRLAAGV